MQPAELFSVFPAHNDFALVGDPAGVATPVGGQARIWEGRQGRPLAMHITRFAMASGLFHPTFVEAGHATGVLSTTRSTF